MNTLTIPAAHRERLACVYVRQSTSLQVRQHQESTERQYQLRERAIGLGWPPTAVEVIDEDQGRSGQSALHRTGFQRLVAQVSLGKVGIVLMLEASRLARNNSDWSHLIELCGRRQTLLADEQAVYDPREPNDRLLLGVKGTLSEAELFTLRTRLFEGRWNKARKGVLRFPLPVGYVWGEDGRWDLDPHLQVRERLQYIFASFRRHGVARAVVRDLHEQQLQLPAYVVAKENYGALVWKTPTLSAVVRMLANPAYAGAYVYGRWEYLGEQRSLTTGRAAAHLRALADWPVCILDHHPAYLSWEEFVGNRERLRANWYRDGQPGAARDGGALLQGIVGCGVCGRKMAVQHHTARAGRSAAYLCSGNDPQGDRHLCQTLSARPVDAAVVAAFLEAASPLSLEISLRVLDRIEQELAEQRHQWELQVEQARYEARLAQRRYDAIDPENRLVAAELERRWNEKLERVAGLEKSYARIERQAPWTVTADERDAIRRLAQDLPGLWHADTTTNRDREQLLRLAIETVDLDRVSRPGQVAIQIHWRTGTITRLEVKLPTPGDWSLKMPPEAVDLIQTLVPTHNYADIAEQLNAAGWHTAFGRRFTSQHVGYTCRRNGWGRGIKHPRCASSGQSMGRTNSGER
jgi:DNA invertase Pin-like site-specific DNA recombinase